MIAAWAVVLLIAFFANRGEDAGRLGQLVGNLGGGAIFGGGLADGFVGSLVAVLILLSWFGLGSLLMRFVSLTKNEKHLAHLRACDPYCTGALSLVAYLVLSVSRVFTLLWLRRC